MDDKRRTQKIADAIRNVYATAENFGCEGEEIKRLADKLGEVSQLLLGGIISLPESGQEYFDRLDRQKEGREISREPIDPDEYRESLRGMMAQGQERVRQAVESGETSPEIENYLTRVPEQYRPLARAFCVGFGRPPLKSEDAMWRRGWTDQKELGITPDLVAAAFARMKDQKLTIKSPQSITAIAEDVKREKEEKKSVNQRITYRS